jgi:hypothetical protein
VAAAGQHREREMPSPTQSFSSSRDTYVKGETSFPLFPFLDGKSASRIQEGYPLACLLKILILTKATQILLHPGLATIPSGK